MSLEALLQVLITVAALSGPQAPRAAERIEIPVPPPAPLAESIPPARSGHLWTTGYWSWNGTAHVWTAGRWQPIQWGAQWVPDRWVAIGERWRFEAGHWLPNGSVHTDKKTAQAKR